MERQPHDPRGGERPELRIAPETEESTDERAIREGIEAALRDHRDIDDRTAATIATQLHEGQASALYSLASTGMIDERVHDELTRNFDQQPEQVKDWINWLGTYCVHRPEKGPIPGWTDTTISADDEAAARAELARRISNAAVTTLGQIATILTPGGDTLGVADSHGRPERHGHGYTAEELDGLFTEIPDEELGTVEDIGWFGLLRHTSLPGGTILAQDSNGFRDARVYDTGPALDTAWAELRSDLAAHLDAVRAHNREPGDHDAETDHGVGPQPEIWVGSLADYNNGIPHGVWLDATLSPGELVDAIAFMLRNSPTGDAEEYAVMDYSDFFGIDLGQQPPLDNLSRIANGIAEHGEPYAHWAAHVGTGNLPALERFEHHYRGRFDSIRAYAEHILAETNAYDHLERLDLPEDIRDFATFDTQTMAADMEHYLHIIEAADGAVHIFDPRIS
ncbi:MAG TPA: antirestriction protein ArdA [Propionibacteriaceae bacterium]